MRIFPPVPVIEHVSDTARWVAIYRAMESERPDALIRDPYPRRRVAAISVVSPDR